MYKIKGYFLIEKFELMVYDKCCGITVQNIEPNVYRGKHNGTID